MRSRLLTAAFALLTSGLMAQNQAVNLSMGAGYANDIYYSFANGQVKTEPGNNWHLAFTARIVDASIMINEVGGQVEAYVAANDTTSWATLDTTGLAWTALHNSTEDWALGALSNLNTPFPDYGWGTYSTITNNVVGTRIFILKIGGIYKKFMVRIMKTNGDYIFRMANLDGSNEVVKTVNKNNYSGKNFFYYNVLTDQFLDREPATASWDFVVRRYLTEIQSTWYPVTGIQTNLNRVSSMISGVDTASNNWSSVPLDDVIDNIGSDWKSFNNTTFAWELADSTIYFATSVTGDLYKVVFTSFAGSSSGNFSFNQRLVSGVGVAENEAPSFTAYPNPSHGSVNLVLENPETIRAISIVDLAGRVVQQLPLVPSQRIEDLSAGTYLLVLETAGSRTVEKLIVR